MRTSSRTATQKIQSLLKLTLTNKVGFFFVFVFKVTGKIFKSWTVMYFLKLIKVRKYILCTKDNRLKSIKGITYCRYFCTTLCL